MREQTGIGFGILIAYVLPGFTVLVSLSLIAPPLRVWLLGSATEAPAVGGVLYVTAASVLIGQLLNLLRWITLDRLYERTGLSRPSWNERLLQDRLHAFQLIVENHFRYHQFYGNLAIALPLCLLAFRASEYTALMPWGAIEIPLFALTGVLIAGSRDALRRYFLRTQALLDKEKPS